MTNPYKPTQTSSLFPEEFRLQKLSEQGDPLEKLNKVIYWEYFRETAEKMLNTDKLVNSGAKPYDPLLMFKILVLQRYYNLGDEQIEYQILDRLTFCRFLGLSLNDRVPDEKTIWLFREGFVEKGLEREVFDRFNGLLEENGLIANEGKIVDASFVEAPRQRNTRAENEQIKNGEIPEEWAENPNKKRQKDTDGNWTKKNDETHFGYKDHTLTDNKHKFIDDYQSTPASVHDSQPVSKGTLLNKLKARYKADPEKEKEGFWADSAYIGPEQEQAIEQAHMVNKVHEKGARNNPLTEEQKLANKEKSKTRVRVEHVFGFMEQSMNKLYVRSIGIKRANGFIGLVNFTYNLFRYEQVVRINKEMITNWG